MFKRLKNFFVCFSSLEFSKTDFTPIDSSTFVLDEKEIIIVHFLIARE